MFKRILIATDGSVHSRRAALTAAALARALGASLTLLAVYQVPPAFEGEPDYSRHLDAALRETQSLLDAEAAAIDADGGRLGTTFLGSVSAHVAAHSPIPVLVVRGAD